MNDFSQNLDLFDTLISQFESMDLDQSEQEKEYCKEFGLKLQNKTLELMELYNSFSTQLKDIVESS